MSPAEQEALKNLLPPEQRTGDLRADLIAAAQEAWDRRERNTRDGGHVLAALYRDAKSWRAVAWATGIKATTARRWAIPPRVADDDRPDEDESGAAP